MKHIFAVSVVATKIDRDGLQIRNEVRTVAAEGHTQASRIIRGELAGTYPPVEGWNLTTATVGSGVNVGEDGGLSWEGEKVLP